MCGIAGFFHPNADYTREPKKWRSVLNHMNQVQRRRGLPCTLLRLCACPA